MSHIEPRIPLESLDPGEGDPGYWLRFQSQVMAAVGPALIGRRGGRLTLGDAVLSWSRICVPLAVAAAACAMFLLIQSPEPEVLVTAGVEEFLVDLQLEGEAPLPSFFHTEETVDRDVILLAVEGI
jgi:hypothetical protein